MKNTIGKTIALLLITILVFNVAGCEKYTGKYNAVLIYQAAYISSFLTDLKVEIDGEDKLYVEDEYLGYLADSTFSSAEWFKDSQNLYISETPSKISLEKIMQCTQCKKVFVESQSEYSEKVALLKVNNTIIMLYYGRVYELQKV